MNTPKRIKYKGIEYKLVESKALKEAHISDDDIEVVAMIASDAEESAHELVDKLDRLLREAYALCDDNVVIDEVEDAITAIEELEQFLSNEAWVRYLPDDDDDYDESLHTRKSSGIKESRHNRKSR